ncbi:ImmA/IrrE family metallo-endopeptidase [Streptomyces sp. MBT67]|uniref:ImmA/IrrE family metallo-endopeptidase n=1 Tax=unclassified Streptomyces TaxID=2593676 RepID=UPI00190DA3D8|nr:MULTISPECIES: ImmA/IrrE family metallo-endopeptidase [unclassified Streptomyces]MBK3528652.1 ImmA/IrrE family metallo-endopeptidase [Streptomyces sp. MBT72]MBK3535013.1 ImmA/IrrE family metallo-endopeptidase [Streptomyces sp. MBT67]MBK3548893.1 ImmA/IrrE family metallo-endopeptidase [Streptomyces sp. MBT61]MBK6026997.1 ImmA/IrrE family metallo-endopeptidase [Streptomyces sp. MBT59]
MANPVKAAQSLLQKYAVETFPVPIESIARTEGVIITRKAFDGTQSGFALRDGQTRIIGVNSATSPRRQRFTIAHEMGHLDLHEGKPLIVDHAMRIDWRDDVSSLGTNEEEIEANAFAAEILMPTRMIRSQVVSYGQDGITRDRLIVQLARDFDVSAEAMGYRLINLGILAS